MTLIRALRGAPRGDLRLASVGDVVALFGLSSVRNGDLLGHAAASPEAGLTQPVTTVRARLADGDASQPSALFAALMEIEEEDPDLRLEWSALDREARLAVMGPVHVEFLASTLRARYGLRVELDQPTPAFLETVGAPCTGSGAYTGALGDPRFGARVSVRLEPLPRGGGVAWDDRVRDLPPPYAAGAVVAVPDCLRHAGPLRNRAVVDVRVVMTDARWSPLARSGASRTNDFLHATAAAVLAALAACEQPILLAPMLRYELTAPEGAVARATACLAELDATFEVGVAGGGRVRIQGELPAAAAWEAPTRLAALTKGRGLWDARMARYRVARHRAAD